MQLLVGMLDAALARQQDLVAGGAAGRRRAEDRRGAARDQPRVRGNARAEALGGARDGRVLADRRAVDRARGARPARRAVRPPRLLRDSVRARCARGGRADDGRVLRHRAPGIERLSAPRPPRRPPAPAQAPRDRQLGHARGPPAAVHRRDDAAGVDRERIALHAARQRERGGRHRTDLRQPHWERARRRRAPPAARPPAAGAAASARARRAADAPPPARDRCARPTRIRCRASAAESYRELVELDRAHSVRCARPPSSPRASSPTRSTSRCSC